MNSGLVVAQLEYASAIRSMMYATHCTRNDIAFAIRKQSYYTVNPGTKHWKAVGRVLGYLKSTSSLELTYLSSNRIPKGYYDPSLINHTSDSKYTSGRTYTLAGGTICWESKKNICITHSTMEIELVALATVTKEAE